jgi:hypothetical protein
MTIPGIDPWGEGWNARRISKPYSNPYVEPTTEHAMWERGWTDAGGAEFNDAPEGDEDNSPETTTAILSLVLPASPEELLEDVRPWSEEERKSAIVWASAVHLRASDNIVKVPDEPPHLLAIAHKYQDKAGFGKAL